MSEIACFMLEETGRVRRSLRRYTAHAEKCPAGYYHDATVPFDEVDHPVRTQISAEMGEWRGKIDRAQFPTACACGWAFLEGDHFDLFLERLYRRGDTGEIVTLRRPPVGAMWIAWWYDERSLSKVALANGVREHLIVMTPGGEWNIDAKSSNGDGWNREGVPPAITVRPSILIPAHGDRPEYHGYLTNGKLVPC